ncbi:MAG TPA: hypothetical protein V6D19_11140 [Stenomitos sp.]
MTVVLSPGIHTPLYSERFWQAITLTYGQHYPNHSLDKARIVTDAQNWGFSAPHVFSFLQQSLLPKQSICLIGFSAGVVGAIGAALGWHATGGTVRAFIAVDGWGVPLYGPFPIYRLSHDAFTHWSSQPLGGGQASFYADPGVPHLDLWRSPHQAWGWFCTEGGSKTRSNAASVICQLLHQHECNSDY